MKYEFKTPFRTDYIIINEIRFHKQKEIIPYEIKFENVFVEYEINYNHIDRLKINENAIVSYEFEIENGILSERIINNEDVIKFKSKIKKEQIIPFIESFFNEFGISTYGFVPRAKKTSSQIKKFLLEGIVEGNNFKLDEDKKIYEENFEKKKLTLITFDSGFYYLANFHGDYQVRYFNLVHVLEREAKTDFSVRLNKHLINYINKNKIKFMLN